MAIVRIPVLFLLAVVLTLAACSRPAATVNGRRISSKTLELHVREQAEDLKKQNIPVSDDELRQRVLQQLIDEQLILEEAEKKKIVVPDAELDAELAAIRKMLGDETYVRTLREKGLTEQEFRARTREKLLMMKFIQGLVSRDAVTDEEIRSAYRESPRPFVKSAQVLMNMIEVPDEATAKKMAEEIRTSKDGFAPIAERYAAGNPSIVYTKGWTNPDYFQPPISDAMKELRVGKFGGPYRGKSGFYLVMIEDRKTAEVASFDEVRESIRSRLLDEKRQAALGAWVAERRMKAKITIGLHGPSGRRS